MPGVIQPTEKPGLFDEKMEAMVAQYKDKSRKAISPQKEAEYRVIVKNALNEEALDKIEFSLRGEIRRGKPKKMGLSDPEFSALWRKKMKQRLEADGFTFKLDKAEQEILASVVKRVEQKKIDEISSATAEALKRIITTV